MNNIEKYFDKEVNIVLYIDKIKSTITKKNETMAFISASDEFDSIDIVVFPNKYDSLIDINKGDIVYITGIVEKRMSRYQLVLEKISKL